LRLITVCCLIYCWLPDYRLRVDSLPVRFCRLPLPFCDFALRFVSTVTVYRTTCCSYHHPRDYFCRTLPFAVTVLIRCSAIRERYAVVILLFLCVFLFYSIILFYSYSCYCPTCYSILLLCIIPDILFCVYSVCPILLCLFCVIYSAYSVLQYSILFCVYSMILFIIPVQPILFSCRSVTLPRFLLDSPLPLPAVHDRALPHLRCFCVLIYRFCRSSPRMRSFVPADYCTLLVVSRFVRLRFFCAFY